MNNRKKIATIIKFIILVLLLTAVPGYLYFRCRDTLFDPVWLSQLPGILRHYQWHAVFVLTALQALQVVICIIPGQPIQIAASYLFGVPAGYALSIGGALIGSVAAFHLAKWLGKDAVSVIFDSSRVEEYQKRLNSGRGLLALLFIYLIPGLPKDMAGYAAGISNMRIRPFLLVSTIGRTPPMLASLLLGYFAGQGNYTGIAVLAVVTAVFLGVCFIKRKELISLLDRLERYDEIRHNN